MVEIRPIWDIDGAVNTGTEKEVTLLLALEKYAENASALFFDLAKTYIDEEEVLNLSSLRQSCKNDLIAGCELARSGYFKQAYSLWRSWFEQSLFTLYFLEAPIHRTAWKVSEEVSLDDSPKYRLMLHQLLNDSGERHPFTLVYDERYLRLMESLGVNSVQIPKDKRPIRAAIAVLTALSQGVHGTYQPASATSYKEACELLNKHCLPVLEKAVDTVTIFWLLLLTTAISLPQNILVSLRKGDLNEDQARTTELDAAEKLILLSPYFKRVFGSIT